MTFYGVILSLHVGAALLLAAALGIDACILYGLGRSASPEATRLGLNLWGAVPPMAGGAGVLLLLTGLYLTGQMAAWKLGWPMVALAVLILIGAFGGVASKRMRKLRQTLASTSTETRQPEAGGQLRDPLLKLSINIRIALVLAAVLLMSVKPGLTGSLGIAGIAAISGVLLALPFSAKRARSRQSHASDAGAASANS